MQRNSSGFTLVEFIIVLALIAVIGSITVPNVMHTLERSKVVADIQSTRTLQSAVELYRAEKGDWPGTAAAAIIQTLSAEQYLKQVVSNQSEGVFYWNESKKQMELDVSSVSGEIIDSLSDNDKSMLKGSGSM